MGESCKLLRAQFDLLSALFFCLSYFLAHSLSSPFIWHKERIRATRLENDSHHFSNPPIFHLVSSFRAERAALFLCHSLGEPTMQLAFHFIVSQSNNLLLFLSYFSFNEGYIKFGATAENLIGFLPQEKQSLGCMWLRGRTSCCWNGFSVSSPSLICEVQLTRLCHLHWQAAVQHEWSLLFSCNYFCRCYHVCVVLNV